jgi:hypothetical protein
MELRSTVSGAVVTVDAVVGVEMLKRGVWQRVRRHVPRPGQAEVEDPSEVVVDVPDEIKRT